MLTKRIIIHSSLAKEEAINRIKDNIANGLIPQLSRKRYDGNIDSNGNFNLRPQNKPLIIDPKIQGKIKSGNEGCIIEIVVSFQIEVAILGSVVFGLLALGYHFYKDRVKFNLEYGEIILLIVSILILIPSLYKYLAVEYDLRSILEG